MKAVLFLAGKAPSEKLIRSCCAGADFIVCADDGIEPCLKAGFSPDIAVGDMDSVSGEVIKAFEYGGGTVQRLPVAKCDTDGYAALRHVFKKQVAELTILGGQGGRFDHALGNVYLLVAAEKAGISARMLEDWGEIRVTNGQRTFHGQVGDLLSLLPLGDACVAQSSGLAYPLENLRLTIDYPLGLSNVFTQTAPHIEVTEGWIISVHFHKNPAQG